MTWLMQTFNQSQKSIAVRFRARAKVIAKLQKEYHLDRSQVMFMEQKYREGGSDWTLIAVVGVGALLLYLYAQGYFSSSASAGGGGGLVGGGGGGAGGVTGSGTGSSTGSSTGSGNGNTQGGSSSPGTQHLNPIPVLTNVQNVPLSPTSYAVIGTTPTGGRQTTAFYQSVKTSSGFNMVVGRG
jgi:hypothetical protein